MDNVPASPALNLRILFSLVLLHALVDCTAQIIAPLWPLLEKQYDLTGWSGALMIAAWQVSTSVSQPVFGYWGDRFGSRWVILLGPAVAIICISLLGLTSNAVMLILLLIVGGLGIGAFHPEAAVSVVEAAGRRVSLGLALFICGGMVGLGLGPRIGGAMVERHGLSALLWLMAPGIVILAILSILIRRTPARVMHHDPAGNLADLLRGRRRDALVLLTVSTMRAVPGLGIPFVIAFWLDQQGIGEEEIGRWQSLFLWSGGLGTLLFPLFIKPGKEIAGLVLTNLPAAGCILFLIWDNPMGFYIGLAGAGLLLQGATPILIAYSQRLLPRSRRIAASLILGTSWGLAGLIVAGLHAYFRWLGRFEGYVLAMIPFALLAAAGSLFLPTLRIPEKTSAA